MTYDITLILVIILAEKRKNMKSDDSKKDVPENEDYMDADMRTMDENVKKRIQDILQDYKDQMQKYNPPSGDDDKPKTGTEFDIFRLTSPPHSR